jgi:hypothetical protein
VTALIAPNGAGKSSVLRMLLGLDRAGAGPRSSGRGHAGIVVTLVLTAGTMVQRPGPADRLRPLSAGRNRLLDPAYQRLGSGPGPAWVVLVAWALVTVGVAGAVLARWGARCIS